MPLAIYSIIRISRAVVSTLRLLADVETMRRLPWSHIRRLPREDKWIGFACFCLLASVTLLLVGVVAHSALHLAAFAAAAGLFASWVRPRVGKART